MQKTLHINDKVQVESQVTSALKGRKNKSPPVWLFRGSVCTGILGLDGLSDQVHCVAGSIANWQIPWEGFAPRRAGVNFPNRKTPWPTCKLHKEAGAMMLNSNMPDSFSPTPGSDHS